MVVSKGTPQLAGEIADSCNVISKDELKSLGVTIDRNLHFTEHISAPCKKVSVGVGVLMRMWRLIPVEAQSRIFQAATSPYCGLVWHFCRSFNSRKVERVNERGLRAVYCDFSSPYGELLAKAHLTSLYKRWLQDIAILMFKVKYYYYILLYYDIQQSSIESTK